MFSKLFGKKKPVVTQQTETVVLEETIQEDVIEEVATQIESETLVEPIYDELMHYIAFYNTPSGGKAKGYWQTSQAKVDEETNSFLFKNQLGYTRYQTASISHAKVVKIAEELNINISDVLASVG